VNKNTLAWIAIIFTTAIWASSLIMGKIVFDTLNEMTPIIFVALRYTIACPFLLIIGLQTGKVSNRTINRRTWGLIMLAGITGPFLSQTFQYIGLDLTTASDAVLLLNLTPVFSVILASPILNEKITPEKMIGLLLALVGATLIVINTASVEAVSTFDRFFGNIIIIASTALFAINGIAGKISVQSTDSVSVTLYSTLTAVPFLWIAAALFEDLSILFNMSILSWSIILWVGIINTALAFILYYEAMNFIEASKLQIALSLIAVWGVLMSVLVLGDLVSLLQILGGTITVIGVVIAQISRKNKAQQTEIPIR